MDYKEYRAYVALLATECTVDGVIDTDRLHESCDGSQYVIYHSKNKEILENCESASFYAAEDSIRDCGDAGAVFEENGYLGLQNLMAYWCLYHDVLAHGPVDEVAA